MTDITELALLVSKAKASVFTLEYISQFEPADIDSDDVDLRFEVDGRDTGTNVSIVDECGQAAKVIGTLVEALEKAQGMEAYWKTQCRGITDHCEELQARIAELEREQEHLRPVGVMSEQAFHRLENRECRFIALWPRPGIFLPRKRPEDGVIVYARTAAAAGIKVEADSLDADVSNRNQPGMVVAVHIDVGDFVKFRGRVYEVKEIDFDDHDVTLWFVCGEVLKCAAGCPIEVVSAPVEDE
ncbi:hypothetical protein [Klebsiella pneumoniae]|uniref:hypothetical protein n=1 Tax=Klebsiella pneumoniae TaxID=573 RepID=UPI001FADAC18|nr:hypothetical protein [Klebsiella pneumoniae]